jgi:hypothetical protein
MCCSRNITPVRATRMAAIAARRVAMNVFNVAS